MTTTTIRSTERDAVEDLKCDTPNAEIAELPTAHADRRPAAYASKPGGKGVVVGPHGEIALPSALPAEILTPDERAAHVARAIAEQLPSPAKTMPHRALQDTREWLAFLRKPGTARDPKHIALSAAEREIFGEADLVLLKGIFPALRIVELGDRPGDEEAEIRFELLTIFKDDDA